MATEAAEKMADDVKEEQGAVPAHDEDFDTVTVENKGGRIHIKNNKPIPTAVKFGVPGALIVVVTIAFMGVQAFTSEDVVTSADGVPVVAGIEVSDLTGDKGTNIADASVSDALKSLTSVSNDHDQQFQTLLAENVAINKELKRVSDNVNDYKKAVADLENKVELITGESAKEFIDAQSTLQKSIADVLALAKNNQRHINSFKRRGKDKPPFDLLSIDEWDTKSSAVIRLKDKYSIATVGDIRAGWRITNITKPNCIVVKKLSSKKEFKLCHAKGG